MSIARHLPTTTNSENSTNTNLYSAGAEVVVDVAVAAAEGVVLVVAAPVDAAGVAVEKNKQRKVMKKNEYNNELIDS